MAKTLTSIFGVIFALVGLLGFVSNPLVGAGAVFETDMMHNLVHLVTGLILLAVAFLASRSAALVLKVVGAVYLVLGVVGFYASGGYLLGLIASNGADNWLHLALGIVLLAVGFLSKGETEGSMQTFSAPPQNTPGQNPMRM